MASPWASAGARSEAPNPRGNKVCGEASVARRPALGSIPSSLPGEDGSEGERAGEDERADAGPGVTLMCMGPWNRRVLPSHSGSGSVARSSYCPRRMGGSFAGCWVKGCLTQGKEKERGGGGSQTVCSLLYMEKGKGFWSYVRRQGTRAKA